MAKPARKHGAGRISVAWGQVETRGGFSRKDIEGEDVEESESEQREGEGEVPEGYKGYVRIGMFKRSKRSRKGRRLKGSAKSLSCRRVTVSIRLLVRIRARGMRSGR